jgi:hypothetical protein
MRERIASKMVGIGNSQIIEVWEGIKRILNITLMAMEIQWSY